MLTIFKTTLNPGSAGVVVQFREEVVSLEGAKTIDSYVCLTETKAPLDKAGWTNEDLINAVAAHYNIDPSNVVIESPAPAPVEVPVEEVEEVEEVPPTK